MAALLSIEDGFKAYNGQELLVGASAQFHERQKVGILGRNGTGKSTLLRILLGDEELDGGRVFRHENLRLGYLRQHDPFLPGETVSDFLMRDSGQPDWRCAEVAFQFAIGEEQLRGSVKDLSGGWQTRVKLAALLLHDPNLLMLDEPTNFLDIRTQILLQHFLQSYRGALILISHDRRFLKAACDVTCELRNAKLVMEPGNVDVYLQRQAERHEQQRRSNSNLKAKRDQLQKFVDSNRASAGTASQARNKAKQVARLDADMQEIDDGDGPVVKMRVPEVEPRKGTALLSKDLIIGYGDTKIASEINLDVDHGSRVAVVGDNGQGKTTLLRSLAATLDPLGGSVKWGYGCQVALYAQHVYSSIDNDDTVRSYLEKQATPGTSTQAVQDTAGSFLFSGVAIEKPIGVLSGGERARLCLAGLLLGKANVLILDEPSNHLDVESVEALADALCGYRGTILCTSHDRDFIERIATNVIEVKDGTVRHFPGDYENYLYRVRSEIEESLARESGAAESQTKKVSSGAQDYKRAKKIKSIEKRIKNLEQQKQQAETALAAGGGESRPLTEKLHEMTERLARAELEWLELQEG